MKRERKDICPLPPLPAPESASVPAPSLHSFWRELPDFSSRQEVHHRLITLVSAKQLRDLQVSASARFPARHLERESDRPQFGVKDLHSSSAQIAAAGPPLVSVLSYCCGSHSAVI